MSEEITVVMAPAPSALRVLAVQQGQEWLRAALPTPSQAHPRAAATLLEALGLWAQCPVRVVWSADARAPGCDWGLLDALGFGERRLHYVVEWAPARGPRARALGGLGSFRTLHALARTGGRP